MAWAPPRSRCSLDRYDAPAGVRVFDGGTLGLSLLPYIEDAESVILVDAIRTDAAAGTLVRLDGDDVTPAVATRLSPHQVGVARSARGARWRGRYPSHLVLARHRARSDRAGVGLSPAVARAMSGTWWRGSSDEAERSGFRSAARGCPSRDARPCSTSHAGVRQELE